MAASYRERGNLLPNFFPIPSLETSSFFTPRLPMKTPITTVLLAILALFCSTSKAQVKTGADHLIASRRCFNESLVFGASGFLLSLASASRDETMLMKKPLLYAGIGLEVLSAGYLYTTFWHIGEAGKEMKRVSAAISPYGCVLRLRI
ncbi:MAG: hypothetical protein H6585_00785 [Flavobacteriales bacterium]|nr:hypothetical protein [Flavobacteriales bacterium]MCB9446862.1 hypothetical protein [Flavobacteriales bacterium]